jgi:hypothetical protein
MTPGDSIVEFDAFASGFGSYWIPASIGWTASDDAVLGPASATTTTLTHEPIQAQHP